MGIVAIIKMNKVVIIEMGAGKEKHRNQTSVAWGLAVVTYAHAKLTHT